MASTPDIQFVRPLHIFVLAVTVALLATLLAVQAPNSATAQPVDPEAEDRIPYIIGGTDVVDGEFPWLVSVQAQPGNFAFCGGVLIHPLWVLTAAHCAEVVSPGEVDVALGSANDLTPSQRIDVIGIYDPGYEEFIPPYDDVALLELATPVDLSDPNVAVIHVNQTGSVPVPTDILTVAGWGDTDPGFGENYPHVARKVTVPVVACQGDVSGAGETDVHHICAGGIVNEDSCSGDSGGPIMDQGPDGKWSLVGLVSYGLAGCGTDGVYAVYERVNRFSAWIKGTTGLPWCRGFLANVDIGSADVPTAFDDVVWGTTGADTINGLGGDDVICSRGGDDTVRGGDGNDVIDAGAGTDTVRGGDGDDEISGGSEIDKIYGDAGADILNGDGGSDRIRGGDGADVVNAGSGADRVWGGPGDDVINGQGGQDTILGEEGADDIQGNHQSDTIFGGDDDDTLRGAGGKDVLDGEAGNDMIFGGDNSDTLSGGAGHDALDGQKGRDTCDGGPGDNTLVNC